MSDQELRELDAWIAEHVMAYKRGHPGGCKVEYWQPPPFKFGVIPVDRLPRFTTDQAAAMEVLKKCMEYVDGHCQRSLVSVRPKEVALVTEFGAFTSYTGNADTFELAICLFAQKLFSK